MVITQAERPVQLFSALGEDGIAGVVRSFLRSDTPLTRFFQHTISAARSITAFDRRPNAIVSRRWCAWLWRQSL